jgi:hypothetical protein
MDDGISNEMNHPNMHASPVVNAWFVVKLKRRVWESSNSAKITPELQIHGVPPWSSSTMDLRSGKAFGTAPNFPSSL